MGFENFSFERIKKEKMITFEKAVIEEFIECKNKLPEELKKYLTSYTGEQAVEYGINFYLSTDKNTGFGLKDGCELVNAFSLEKGHGRYSVLQAIRLGARRLDCFDKQIGQAKGLVEYYSQFGFKEVKRIPNWVQGEPDVVYMELVLKNKES
ncbi:MAG: hypothetical protein NT091_02310 [Candidatus Falkowbacteria bacterium]|nr:hypothetical protein [Candidatus Falkowbacteria bacterium]